MPKDFFSYFLYKMNKIMKRKTRQGVINDIIDLVIHPLFGKYLGIPEVVDFIFHSLNEGKVDFNKFVKYNLPSMLYGIMRSIIAILRERGFYETS